MESQIGKKSSVGILMIEIKYALQKATQNDHKTRNFEIKFEKKPYIRIYGGLHPVTLNIQNFDISWYRSSLVQAGGAKLSSLTQ